MAAEEIEVTYYCLICCDPVAVTRDCALEIRSCSGAHQGQRTYLCSAECIAVFSQTISSGICDRFVQDTSDVVDHLWRHLPKDHGMSKNKKESS